jgi:tRNA G18 (ribose-2'-O)-methylase SpoU
MLESDSSGASQEAFPGPDKELVNFQRKITPLCSLEWDLKESREKRLRNALGRKKQQLVVCASLIDKVPNLAGLARTSEIFAAARLVIPDMMICRMDNFKSISVGAGEWIDIEGCKESVSVSFCS